MILILVGFVFFLQWKLSLSICGRLAVCNERRFYKDEFNKLISYSFQGTTCCSGTFWNKEKSICERCPLGYHSVNCSEVCIFPNFGNDCQSICNCSVNVCDHRFGCKGFVGIRSYGTTASDASGRMNQTLQKKSTDMTSFGQRPDNKGLSDAIVYIIIALVCAFMILFGLFVGVYFYKHCIKPTTQIDITNMHSFNSVDGYKSLAQPENNQAIENIHDSTYLEPVFETSLHYNEIENKDEIIEEGMSDVYVQKQNA